MTIGTVAILVMGLLAFWVLGGTVLRVAGAGIALFALLGLAISGGRDIAAGLLILVFGLFLWLAGHWTFAVRHHAYKSPLARRIFLQALPRRLDATRNWGTRTTPIDRDAR